MARASLQLLLLLTVFSCTSGLAMAAHQAVAHHDHDHADRDCPIYQTLTWRAIDAPPSVPTVIFDTSPRFMLTPIDEAAPCVERTPRAQPRGPPVA